MKEKDVVKYLRQYKQLHYRLEFVENKIIGLKAIGYEDNHSSAVQKKSINDYINEKDMIISRMKRIEDLVNLYADTKEGLVIKYNFIEFETLENIADHMHYSIATVKRYYKVGLENLKNMIPNDTK